jgi:hypothetical protein
MHGATTTKNKNLITIFKVEHNYETPHEALFYKLPLLPVPQVR